MLANHGKIWRRYDPAIESAHGVVISRGSTSMRKPRGGRLLIIEKMIPHARSAATTV